MRDESEAHLWKWGFILSTLYYHSVNYLQWISFTSWRLHIQKTKVKGKVFKDGNFLSFLKRNWLLSNDKGKQWNSKEKKRFSFHSNCYSHFMTAFLFFRYDFLCWSCWFCLLSIQSCNIQNKVTRKKSFGKRWWT